MHSNKFGCAHMNKRLDSSKGLDHKSMSYFSSVYNWEIYIAVNRVVSMQTRYYTELMQRYPRIFVQGNPVTISY